MAARSNRNSSSRGAAMAAPGASCSDASLASEMTGGQRAEQSSSSSPSSGRSGSMGNSPTAKDIVRSFYALVSKGSMEGLDKIVSENVVDHTPQPGQGAGYEGLKQNLTMLVGAFSDINLKIEKLISQGDIVAGHWSLTARHTGSFMGFPASGKPVSFTGTDMSRIQNGKIVEAWHNEDFLGVLQQIGALQSPQMPDASEPSSPEEENPMPSATREAAIRGLLDQFITAWNSGDVEAMVALFTPDAVMMDTSGQRAQGPEQIQTQLSSMLQGWAKNTQAALQDVSVKFLAALAAYAEGAMVLTPSGASTPGTEMAPMSLHMTAVAVRRAGGWLLSDMRLYTMAGAPAPAPEPAPTPQPIPERAPEANPQPAPEPGPRLAPAPRPDPTPASG